MMVRRAAGLFGLLVLAWAGNAAAQVPMMGNLPSFDNAPAAPPPGAAPAGVPMAAPPGAGPQGGPPPGMQGGPQGGAQGGPPCFAEFTPLREEAEKRARMIKAAADKKGSRQEICQLFKNFAVAEEKVIKFVTAKQAACQIPPTAVSQMQANHDRTVKTRDHICAAGPGEAGAAPPVPRLSDELGIARDIGEPTKGSAGSGTFNTLTGNALGR